MSNEQLEADVITLKTRELYQRTLLNEEQRNIIELALLSAASPDEVVGILKVAHGLGFVIDRCNQEDFKRFDLNQFALPG